MKINKWFVSHKQEATKVFSFIVSLLTTFIQLPTKPLTQQFGTRSTERKKNGGIISSTFCFRKHLCATSALSW